MGKMIRFSGEGRDFDGYLAKPLAGSGPAVIVLQEWWGLVGHIRDICDRLADEGFVALAPDLYDGDSTTEPDEAGSLMMALNIDKTALHLRASIDFLDRSHVGVMGFCMGGQLALYAACIDSRVAACVDFYGIHPNAKPDLAGLSCSVLGFFAEHDEYASPAAVAALEAELTALGKVHEFHTYEGTSHAFFNDARPAVYDGEAAADAWKRTLAFLRRHLGQA